LWLLGQTDDPAYPDLLQVLAGLCDISWVAGVEFILYYWLMRIQAWWCLQDHPQLSTKKN
jgi:hypothetical protein